MLNVKMLSLPPLGTNCYIVSDTYRNECIIIDPASSAEKISKVIRDNNLKPKKLILTHGHFDHMGAAETLREEYKIPLYIHENDAELLSSPEKNASGLLPYGDIKLSPPDGLLKEGDKIKIGEHELLVHHTPGHTMGSCVFVGEKELFSGDTLFRKGYGRYDLYGGDKDALFSSLKKLLALDGNLTVYPGHGQTTKISHERDRGYI